MALIKSLRNLQQNIFPLVAPIFMEIQSLGVKILIVRILSASPSINEISENGKNWMDTKKAFQHIALPISTSRLINYSPA